MKNIQKLLVLSAIFLLTIPAQASVADNIKGKILLQVESFGESWYVHPETGERDYLGHPEDAYIVMRNRGVGITNTDLQKIPTGFFEMHDIDSDNDGLVDAFEQAIGSDFLNADGDGDGFDDKVELINGYNLIGSGKTVVDEKFAQQHLGKIFLQVESRGQAWWVNPDDGKKYYLGNQEDAYSLMRSFGLGISEQDINQIRVSDMTMFAEPVTEARDIVRVSNIRQVQTALELYFADQGEYPSTERGVILGSKYERTQELVQFGWANHEDVIESDMVYMSQVPSDPMCDLDLTRCNEPYFSEYRRVDGDHYVISFFLETNEVGDLNGPGWFQATQSGTSKIESPSEIDRLSNLLN